MDYFIDFANHKDKKVFMVGCGVIPLKRGQHVFGTQQLAEFIGVDRGRIRRKLKILENIDFLTIETTNKYSIATVINYDTYQSDSNSNDQQNDQQTTSNRPATDQQPTTPNNDNNVKNINNVPFQDIVSYLNEKSNKQFRHTTKATKSAIRARWNEGFRFDDFKRVIDTKCAKWATDEKMVDYLRPQTLFGTKFEAYLNECGPKQRQIVYDDIPGCDFGEYT